jgi:hypothetical protein
MQLSLLAPGLVGLTIAIASVVYAHWIATSRPKRSATPAAETAEDTQYPFEFSPPTAPMSAEGTIRVTVRRPERVH